jgi:hypothetical protein
MVVNAGDHTRMMSISALLEDPSVLVLVNHEVDLRQFQGSLRHAASLPGSDPRMVKTLETLDRILREIADMRSGLAVLADWHQARDLKAAVVQAEVMEKEEETHPQAGQIRSLEQPPPPTQQSPTVSEGTVGPTPPTQRHRTQPRVCDNCGKEAMKIPYCLGCLTKHFCDERCQGSAWRAGHKEECPLLRQDQKAIRRRTRLMARPPRILV